MEMLVSVATKISVSIMFHLDLGEQGGLNPVVPIGRLCLH